MIRFGVMALVIWLSAGCVTRMAYDELTRERQTLQSERDALAAEVERLQLERDSLEAQFFAAQESYEDERIARSALEDQVQSLESKVAELGRELAAERNAHLAAASALAERETEIAGMQSTYDELITDLESELSSGQIQIERLREGLRLNVADDVLFESGSAELDSIGREVLTKVAGELKRLDDFIEVRGHTDDRPIRGSLAARFPTNWELAAARASRVVRLLEEQGVPGRRLAAVSRAANDPRRSNDSVENRALNRRIEIRLLPSDRRARDDSSGS